MLKRQYIRELEKTIDALKQTINILENDNLALKIAKRERDKMIVIEYNKNEKLKSRIEDLETNIEFLYNNLSPAKKKQIYGNNGIQSPVEWRGLATAGLTSPSGAHKAGT